MIQIRTVNPYLCGPQTPIRTVLERFNVLDHPHHLVVDEAGRLLGTVTDGDIRRGLLRGLTLDEPIAQCMHDGGITGRVGDDAGNAAALQQVEFLPVLDANGTIAEILFRHAGAAPIETCLVMAGGHGKRLGERTRSTPKPLLSVDGKPILERILTRLEDAKVSDIFIAVHYLADQIKDFAADRQNRSAIRFIDEEQKLGTAGALARLPRPIEKPVLVVNGDVVSLVDFVALKAFHDRHGFDATIAVAQYEVEVPFGVVQQSEDGLFLGIEEKPLLRNFVAAGIYYVSPEFCALVPEDRPVDMPDLINRGREAGLRVGLFPIHEYWVDVGRPADLESANRSYPTTLPSR